jgi:hypothetical protein
MTTLSVLKMLLSNLFKSNVSFARKYEENSWLTVQLANLKIVKMYKKGASQSDMINIKNFKLPKMHFKDKGSDYWCHLVLAKN